MTLRLWWFVRTSLRNGYSVLGRDTSIWPSEDVSSMVFVSVCLMARVLDLCVWVCDPRREVSDLFESVCPPKIVDSEVFVGVCLRTCGLWSIWSVCPRTWGLCIDFMCTYVRSLRCLWVVFRLLGLGCFIGVSEIGDFWLLWWCMYIYLHIHIYWHIHM